MSAKHLITAQWGVGASLARPPTRPALKELADALEAANGSADYLARQLAYAELCPRKGLRGAEVARLDEACASIAASSTDDGAARWPRFVARSLREEELPELGLFLQSVRDCHMKPADAAAWSEVEPLEMGVVLGANAAQTAPDPYKVEEGAPTKLYLNELLGGKKTKAPAEPQHKSVPSPAAAVHRRVVRPARPANAVSSASAFQGNQQIVRLGRSNAANARKTSSSSLKEEIKASAAIHRIGEKHRSRTVTIVDDAAELPVPSDSLPERKKREEERLKKKEKELANKRAREEEKKKRQHEKMMEERQKKIAARLEHRQNRRRSEEYEDEDYEEEEEVIDVDGAADVDEFSGGTKRVTARPGSPVSKRARAELTVPRREVQSLRSARTGDDAFRARARLSGPIAQINELDTSFARAPTYESAGGGDEILPANDTLQTGNGGNDGGGEAAEEEERKESPYEQAVGELERNLSRKDAADLRKFVNVGSMPQSWFLGSDRREFVLEELDDYSLVLRCHRDGSWQRVRLASV